MDNLSRLQAELNEWPVLPGITMADVLKLPEPLSTALRNMVRQNKMTLAEFSAALDMSPQDTLRLAQTLIAKGFITPVAQTETNVYRLNYARTHGRDLPPAVWEVLENPPEDE